MKKILALAIMAIASISASAQLYVGGSLGFWHDSDNNGYSTNEFSILPEIGYNLNNTWAIGTTIGYDHTALCGTESSLNIFQFNPYARYTYFRTSDNMLSLFVDGTAGVGAGWASYKDDDSDTGVIWEVGLKPGLALNFSEHFSFVAHVGMLGYKGANDTAKGFGYSNQGGLTLKGTDISFGFYYNF